MRDLGSLCGGFCEEEKKMFVKFNQLTLCNSLLLDAYKIVRLYCCYTDIF